MEYFLKWKGFPYSQNSWEPIDNLGCPELIEAFEESRQKELKEREGGTSDASEDKKKSKDKDDDKVGSFFSVVVVVVIVFLSFTKLFTDRCKKIQIETEN